MEKKTKSNLFYFFSFGQKKLKANQPRRAKKAFYSMGFDIEA